MGISVCLAGSLLAVGAVAADPQTGYVTRDELLKVRDSVAAQEELIAKQQKELDDQAKRIAEQRRVLEQQLRWLMALDSKVQGGGTSPQVRFATHDGTGQNQNTGPALAQATPGQTPGQPVAQPTGPVGQAPSEEERQPRIAPVGEFQGVLTPTGTLVVEPSIQYSHSSINRFFFQGIEVLETVLVGDLEASDADRESIIAATALRYGITSRLEAEVKVPYVSRNDRITNQIVSSGQSSRSELSGDGIGDIEGAARFQINRGWQGGEDSRWPVFIASMRAKSNTGHGPFEVKRNAAGIETELPTGSGFWAYQPGISMLHRSDPMVLFANVNYLVHMAKDINQTIGGNRIGRVDPGDVLGMSFGMGFAANRETSFTLGYEHDLVGRTETEINGTSVRSETLTVGSLLFGISYALSDSMNLNLNLQAGITRDAPDVAMTLRLPIRFNVF